MTTTIDLGQTNVFCCRGPDCGGFSSPLFDQLSVGKYDWPASILQLDDIDAYLAAHRTARKRAAHAERLGYTVARISRADHLDELHAINTSLSERQGRPMADSYRERPSVSRLPVYGCARHRIDEWGVFTADGLLVAYLVLYLSGDMAMISQILGHGDHLARDVMYLLVIGALRDTLANAGPLTVFYNRHDSGTDGLRYFKERLGFQPERIEWRLGT